MNMGFDNHGIAATELLLQSEIELADTAPQEADNVMPIDAARQLIDDPDAAIMSFDVFDTFLVRRCTTPEGVFERALDFLPPSLVRPGLADSYVQHRILAERSARVAKAEAETGTEVTITEIYNRFPRHVFGLRDVPVQTLVEAEFKAELDLCRVNPEIFSLLRLAREKALRVGFISDTYWPAPMLDRLLCQAAPGLEYDFIYASADHGTGKSETLFDIYLREQERAGAAAIHIGDNYSADILGAEPYDIRTVYYPQAHHSFSPLISRENLAAQLLRSKRPDFSNLLDEGLMTVRRVTMGRMQEMEATKLSAASVLGTTLAGFSRFIQQRVAEIEGDGRRVGVLFLGRDGFLPMAVWMRLTEMPAHYVEINRRVSLVGSLHQIAPLQDIFANVALLNHQTVNAVLRIEIPEIGDYFAKQPDGMATGRAFAAALPQLLDAQDTVSLAQFMRHQVLQYLRATIPAFDDYTDLVLADLGYSGTIQRCLRSIFDQEGLKHRLHGAYLISVDESLTGLEEGDTASGYLDDSIVTPTLKRFLLRNIAPLEQLCAAPMGSVNCYDDGEVIREPDTRPTEQLTFCTEIQRASVKFSHLFKEASAELAIDPMVDMVRMRSWSAALLTRLLLLPTAAEQEAYGSMKHDVNLGTFVLHDMINTETMGMLMSTMSLPSVWQADTPPMWIAGNIAAMSGFDSCAYSMEAFGLSAVELIKEHFVGHIGAAVIKNGRGDACRLSCAVMPTGDLRWRIPLLKRHNDSTLAIPLVKFLRDGTIRAVVLQHGNSSAEAMRDRNVETLQVSDLQVLDCRLDGRDFHAAGDNAHLLVPISASELPVTVVTITVTPLPPQVGAAVMDQGTAIQETWIKGAA